MSQKIKIVQIIPSLAVGGAENFVASLSSNFDFSRCDVTIISFKDAISDHNKQLISQTPIKLVTLHKRKGFSFFFIRRFKKALFNEHPDVINAHLHTIFYVNMFIRKLNIPVYYTIHSINNSELRKTYQKAIRKNVQTAYIKLIGISRLVTNSVCNLYNIDYCATIYNGISLPNINQNDNNIVKKYDFINVGRFNKVKNQKMLLSAFDEAYQKDNSLNLLMVGQGELLNNLVEYKKTLNASDNITFITNCDNPTPYYLCSKIFVLSSSYEGNPISILEALSFGLPVVSTAVGGVPDIIRNNVNGILTNPEDEDELTDAMLSLHNNQELCDKMSIQNKELIKQYDIKNTAETYLRKFEKAIRKWKKYGRPS